jgi:hypothetical protein
MIVLAKRGAEFGEAGWYKPFASRRKSSLAVLINSAKGRKNKEPVRRIAMKR